MARPRKKIDPDQVAKLAQIQCTMVEIAAVLQCSVDTLERRFAETIKRSREQGHASLKRAQYKAAIDGNVTMLIWLGKQLLGQNDVIHTELSSTIYNGDKAEAKRQKECANQARLDAIKKRSEEKPAALH